MAGENYDVQVAFDGSAAERGLKSYGTAISGAIRKLDSLDKAGRSAFTSLVSGTKAVSFSRVGSEADKASKSLQTLAKDARAVEQTFTALGKRAETSFGKIAASAKAINFKNQIATTREFTSGLSLMEQQGRRTADAMSALAKAKNSISKGKLALPKSMTDPKSAAGIERTAAALAKLGAVRLNSATANTAGKLGAAIASLRAPSEKLITRLPALFNALATAKVPGALAANLATFSQSIAGFRAPGAAQVRNLANFLNALSTADAAKIHATIHALQGLNGFTINLPPNLTRGLVSSLNQSQRMANRTRGALGGMFSGFTTSLGSGLSALRGFQNQLSLTYQISTVLRTALGALTVGAFIADIKDAGSATDRFALTLGAVATSAEEMNQHMAFLDQFTREVPVRLRDAQVGYAKFATSARIAGMSVADTQAVFSSFSKALVVMGASADDQRLAFMALEQIMSKGKISAEELRQQLGERLPGVMSMLASSMGITTAELDNMMQKGEVGAENLIKLAKRVNSVFGPQMEAALAKPQAKMTAFLSSWDRFQQSVYDNGFSSGLATMFESLTAGLDGPKMQDLAKQVGHAFQEVFIWVGALGRAAMENKDSIINFGIAIAAWMALTSVVGVLGSIASSVAGIGSIVLMTISGVMTAASMLWTATKTIFSGISFVVQGMALAARGVVSFGAALLSGNPVAIGFALAIAAVSAVVYYFWDDIKAFANYVGEKLNWLSNKLSDFVNDWANTDLNPFSDTFGKIVVDGKVVESVRDAGKKVGEAASDGVDQGVSAAGLLDDLAGSIAKVMESVQGKVTSATGLDKLLTDARDRARELQEMMHAGQPDFLGNMAREAEQANQKLAELSKATKDLLDDIDPMGKAAKKYQENKKLLDDLRDREKRGLPGIDQGQYDSLLKVLDAQTLEKRNPFAAVVKSMKEEYQILSKSVDERDAERKVIALRNDLIEKGVANANELAEAMRGVYRAMEDMDKGGSNGIERWASNVKSFREALNDAEQNGVDQLADAITDFTVDGTADFEALGKSILKEINGAIIKNAMKNLLEGFDMGGGKGILGWLFGTEGKRDGAGALDKASALADGVKPITADLVNIIANGISLNGSLLAGPLGLKGPIDGNPAGTALSRVNQGWGVSGASASPGNLQTALDKAAAAHAAALGVKPGQPMPVVPVMKGDLPASIANAPLRPSLSPSDVATGRVAGGFDLFGGASLRGPIAPTVSPTEFAKTLALSNQDIIDLKKTLMTEWVPSAGQDQAKGIVDTILNRQASGHWGPTVADVVNARKQFSDINGPIAWKAGRNSVADFPDSVLASGRGLRSSQFVDQYLAQRAAGTPSIVGDNLNYANPNFSSPNNLPWINALDGPRLGAGNAMHYHGTTPGLQPYRPGAFGIELPGQAQSDVANLAAGFKNEMQPAVQQVAQNFQATMQQPVQQTGQQLQTALAPKADTLGQSFQTAFDPANAQVSQDYVLKMTQANSQIAASAGNAGAPLQDAATSMQQAGAAAQTAGSSLGGLQNILGMLPGPLGQVASGLLSLFQSLGSGGAGGSGGLGGIFSAIGSFFGFAEGTAGGGAGGSGRVLAMSSMSRGVAFGSYAEGTPRALRPSGTPRLGGGFPAQLHDNEAVIPLTRGRKVPVALTGDDKGDNVNHGPRQVVMNIYTPDADSFRKSAKQVRADAAAMANIDSRRNN